MTKSVKITRQADVSKSSPIVIGGVGGSGTRVIASIIRDLGVFIGNNLNKSLDNLDFPGPYNYRVHKHIPEKGAKPFISHEDLDAFTKKMVTGLERQNRGFFRFIRQHSKYWAWGWKAPTSFLFLDFLSASFPNLRFIHLIRNGLDMAYSKNQNQLYRWGHLFDVNIDCLPQEKASLQYWIRANHYAIDQGRKLLGEHFLLVKFDELCVSPKPKIKSITDFLGREVAPRTLDKLCQQVRRPTTMGRYKNGHDLRVFSVKELDELRKLDFTVDI